MEIENQFHLVATAGFSEIDNSRTELIEKFTIPLISTNEQGQASLSRHVSIAYDRNVKPIDTCSLRFLCLSDRSVGVDRTHLDPERSLLHAAQRSLVSHDDAINSILIRKRRNHNFDRFAKLVRRGMCYRTLRDQLAEFLFASIIDVDFISFRDKV